MKTYKITRIVTYRERYEIEADSEQEAVEIMQSGEVDPVNSEDIDGGLPDVDSIEEDEDLTDEDDEPRRDIGHGVCPTCTSNRPNLHPAMQAGGEVQLCPDPWHATITPENTAGRVAEVRALLPRYYPGREGWWTAPAAPVECTCVVSCAEDPPSACSLSGVPHVHPDDGSGTFGPCPEHPDAPGDR